MSDMQPLWKGPFTRNGVTTHKLRTADLKQPQVFCVWLLSTDAPQRLPRYCLQHRGCYLRACRMGSGQYCSVRRSLAPVRRIQFYTPRVPTPTSYLSTVFCKLVVKGLGHESFLGPQPCSGSFSSVGRLVPCLFPRFRCWMQ